MSTHFRPADPPPLSPLGLVTHCLCRLVSQPFAVSTFFHAPTTATSKALQYQLCALGQEAQGLTLTEETKRQEAAVSSKQTQSNPTKALPISGPILDCGDSVTHGVLINQPGDPLSLLLQPFGQALQNLVEHVQVVAQSRVILIFFLLSSRCLNGRHAAYYALSASQLVCQLFVQALPQLDGMSTNFATLNTVSSSIPLLERLATLLRCVYARPEVPVGHGLPWPTEGSSSLSDEHETMRPILAEQAHTLRYLPTAGIAHDVDEPWIFASCLISAWRGLVSLLFLLLDLIATLERGEFP
ncbi:unnamed protein product [Protopolystoma xenopodis]|uniref:Uncharacterized protein n=1 Tax=Protopolystoma xenopodis TaxID=117903 RepID=A0A3S5CC21_9PLAT|nr:unnamed protein product [Protopolystoma xenopodis]